MPMHDVSRVVTCSAAVYGYDAVKYPLPPRYFEHFIVIGC